MTLQFDPFDEYSEYLNSVSFAQVLTNEAYVVATKKVHRRVLAWLVTEYQLARNLQAAPAGTVQAATNRYLAEVRSDLLSTLLIFQLGLYKAASMSCRSALENFFRVIAGLSNLDYRTLTSVHELVEMVKRAPLRARHAEFQRLTDQLFQRYGELCQYVHSAGEEFLTLDRKLSDVPRWTAEGGTAFSDSFTRLLQSFTSVMIYLDPQGFRGLRHDQKELVLDSMALSAKARLVEDLGLL